MGPLGSMTSTQTKEEFVRHRGPVTCVAGIPGSNFAVSSGYDGAVGFIDLDQRRIGLLGYHDHLVNRITVEAGGTRAASVSSDYTIYVWDLRRRALERVLRGHSDDVEDFAFVNDEVGVSVSRDCRVLVWNLTNGSITRVLEGHEKDVLSVAYDSGLVFTSGDDMTLRAWSLESGRQQRMWGPFEYETDTCAIDSVHGRAVLGSDDGKIRLFRIDDGRAVREIDAHQWAIKKVATSPATGDILSAAYDQKIHVWDANTFALKLTLESRPGVWERSLNFSPDGSKVLAGSFDGSVFVWDAASGRCLFEIGDPRRGNACLNDVATGGEGESARIAVVSDDGLTRIGRLEPELAEWTDELESASGRVLCNAVALDVEYGVVVTGSHDQKLHVFELGGDGRKETEVHLGQGPINYLQIARIAGYERQVFAACYTGAIARVDLTGQVRGVARIHEGAVKALRLHPQKYVGVSCSADGALLSWNLDGKLIERFPGHMAIVDDVDIEPNGKRIASVSRDFTLKLYALDGGKLLDSLSLGRRSPKSVCFFDENTVIVSNYWGQLMRFGLDDGSVKTAQIAKNGISGLAKQGPHVVAVSYDGSVFLVRQSDLQVVQTMRCMIQRLQASALI